MNRYGAPKGNGFDDLERSGEGVRRGWAEMRKRIGRVIPDRTDPVPRPLAPLTIAEASVRSINTPLRRGRRSEPCGERVGEPQVGALSHPGDMSVGPNHH